MECKGRETKKICYLGNASSTHTLKMAEYFSKKGYEIDIISFEELRSHCPNIKVHTIPTSKRLLKLMFLYKTYQIQKIINTIKPNIIHAHYLTKYGFFAYTLGLHPTIVSVWGSDILINAKGLARYPVRRILNFADVVHCDGKNSQNELLRYYAFCRDKMCLIYMGVNPNLFCPAVPNDHVIRSGQFTIISTRNLRDIYDIQTLIHAIPTIVQDIPKCRITIVGEGSQLQELKDLAHKLGIAEYINFTGFIPNEQLPKYLKSADIYVSTSLSDAGLAVSTAEAMACGLPVVITDGADNREWVKDGINGFIIPKKSPGVLAERVVYLLKNPELRRKIGENNRHIIVNRYNYYSEMEKLEQIYAELLKDEAT